MQLGSTSAVATSSSAVPLTYELTFQSKYTPNRDIWAFPAVNKAYGEQHLATMRADLTGEASELAPPRTTTLSISVNNIAVKIKEVAYILSIVPLVLPWGIDLISYFFWAYNFQVMRKLALAQRVPQANQ